MSIVLASLLALLVLAPAADDQVSVPAVPAAALVELIPADALAVAVVGDLAASIDHVLDSQVWERLMAGPLGQQLGDTAALQQLRVARGAVLGATALEWRAALAAVCGEGLAGVLLPGRGEGSEPVGVLMAAMADQAAVERGLRTLSVFLPAASRPPQGSSWRVTLGDVVLERRESLLLLADSHETLDRVQGSSDQQPQGLLATLSRTAGEDGSVWVSTALLSADGPFPGVLDDPGVSLIVGQWHAVLHDAPWLSASLSLVHDAVQLSLRAPADAKGLRASHGPFFPEAGELALPRLSHPLAELVAQRDLGAWWNGRDAFLSERGLSEAIKPDGNLSLLFQRDLGADVLAWLEPELLIVAARCETEGAEPEPEYPAAALALVPKAGHPDDYHTVFVNAFFAAVTFTNFDNDGPSRPMLQPDIEELSDGARLYRSRWKPWTGAGPAPGRYNVSPSLLLARDGRLWLSTSAPLLRRIAAAPSDQRLVEGWSLSVDLTEGSELLLANHDALFASQLLKSGGDFAAASEELENLEALAALFDDFSAEARLAPDHYTIELALALR